jgi:putative oxidoreductase
MESGTGDTAASTYRDPGRPGTVTGMKSKEGSSLSTDVASLILRLVLGPMLITHAYNKVFGSGGLQGTTRWFESLGLKPGWVHARMAAATELTAGALLTVGAANPLPAAATIGLMTTAARTDHKGKGFFVFKGGWEYTGVVAAVSAVIAMLGPGRFSVDGMLGRQRRGILWSLMAVIIGVGTSTALLGATYRPEKKDDEED